MEGNTALRKTRPNRLRLLELFQAIDAELEHATKSMTRQCYVELVSAPRPVLLMVRELNMGGCERDVTKIATHIDRSRFTPHVGCFIAKGLRFDELAARKIPVVEFPVKSFAPPSFLAGGRVMARYIREHGIQLAHLFDVPTTLFGVPVARACGIPAIASQLSYRNQLYARRDLFLLRMVDRISTRIVVNSKEIQRHLIEDIGVDPKLTYLCYNGVDLSEFHPGARERRTELNGAKLVIGIVCALREEKGLALLVEAFAKVRAEHDAMKLVIVGDGTMRARIEELRDKLGLRGQLMLVPATNVRSPPGCDPSTFSYCRPRPLNPFPTRCWRRWLADAVRSVPASAAHRS